MIRIEEIRADKEATVRAARKSGDWIGMVDVLAYQYSDKTHFIFELLQNADDALATNVRFDLWSDRLEFTHNGKRKFDDNDRDLTSIVTIGRSSGAGDYTRIGEHGIGFKAVFAYTHRPRIHSGSLNFDIEDVLIPIPISSRPHDLADHETRFVFPFDTEAVPEEHRFRDLVNPETAFTEIRGALKRLSRRTPMFLRHLNLICCNDHRQPFRKISKSPIQVEETHGAVKVAHIKTSDDDGTDEWAVFSEDLVIDAGGDLDKNGKPPVGTVRIAFLLENDTVVAAHNTVLNVFFPTAVPTGLGFLIHGPFKTTKARDNIKGLEPNNYHSDPANDQILLVAARLAASSLEILRDQNRLSPNSYLALPLDNDAFPNTGFFRPVYDHIREALTNRSLLPTQGGSFAPARSIKVAGSAELVSLFSNAQLSKICKTPDLRWLDPVITAGGQFARLHKFLLGQRTSGYQYRWNVEPLVPDIEIGTDSLGKLLTSKFFQEQSVEWLVDFIPFAVGRSNLTHLPFIRLQCGKQVSLPKDNMAERTAWFEPEDIENLNLSFFPLVHKVIAGNEATRAALEKRGIRKIDSAAIVEKSVLPTLASMTGPFSESFYKRQLREIEAAWSESIAHSRTQLEARLAETPWIACIHASEMCPNEIFWKPRASIDVYERTTETQLWFAGLTEFQAFFPHPAVVEVLGDRYLRLVAPRRDLAVGLEPEEGNITLANSYGNNKCGLRGFTPKADIVALRNALEQWTYDRARIVWELLLTSPRLIAGETQSERNYARLKNAPKVREYTQAGEILKSNRFSWVPDRNRHFGPPNRFALTDVFAELETDTPRAKEVAEYLGMKQPEQVRALEQLAQGNSAKAAYLEKIASATEEQMAQMVRILAQELPPQPAPPFRDALKHLSRHQRGTIPEESLAPEPIANPERYEGKLRDTVGEAVGRQQDTPRNVTFSAVRDQPSNEGARHFLYEQYQGHCQVTGDTFPKASANAEGISENYFEVCAFLSYSNADYLNDPGNMLCVSADTAAKLKHGSCKWLDDFDKIIQRFNEREPGGTASARLRLAGEEAQITWSERHFMRFLALWNKA